jgi:hypothetical protein
MGDSSADRRPLPGFRPARPTPRLASVRFPYKQGLIKRVTPHVFRHYAESRNMPNLLAVARTHAHSPLY